MNQEFSVMRFNPATAAFEHEATVGDGGMEKHRETHQCSYAANSDLTPAQLFAAIDALGCANVLVLRSRKTLDLFIYTSKKICP